MKKLILCALAFTMIACTNDSKIESSSQINDKNLNTSEIISGVANYEKIIYYTCPMDKHQHFHNDKPGNCADCGMELVPAVITNFAHAEFHGCPTRNHSNVRQEKPGVCPECKLKLMPMRLVNN